jgi:short-subunit dehydrogenase
MPKQLEGKTIVITGASHGLGKTLVQKVAELGAAVVLIARDEQKLSDVKVSIEKIGGQAFVYTCDLRKPEDVRAMAAKLIKEHPIDILINDAGIWTEDELEKSRPELRQAALETNVLGHIELTEALLPYFKSRNAGHIFNVISSSGVSDSPSGDNSSWRTYGATKWAMRGYTNALLTALKETPIKITGFYPGGFDSDIFETAGNADAHGQSWMMKVEDVADAAIFALTRPADVMIETIVVTKK